MLLHDVSAQKSSSRSKKADVQLVTLSLILYGVHLIEKLAFGKVDRISIQCTSFTSMKMKSCSVKSDDKDPPEQPLETQKETLRYIRAEFSYADPSPTVGTSRTFKYYFLRQTGHFSSQIGQISNQIRHSSKQA